MVRLHVGGLPDDVGEDDLAARFRSFGRLCSVELIGSNVPGVPGHRGFAYVELEASEEMVEKCMKVYKGTRWRGKSLTVAVARPNYLQRLKDEWAAAAEVEVERKRIAQEAESSFVKDTSTWNTPLRLRRGGKFGPIVVAMPGVTNTRLRRVGGQLRPISSKRARNEMGEEDNAEEDDEDRAHEMTEEAGAGEHAEDGANEMGEEADAHERDEDGEEEGEEGEEEISEEGIQESCSELSAKEGLTHVADHENVTGDHLLNSEALIGQTEQADTLKLLEAMLPDQLEASRRKEEAAAKVEERRKHWGPWQSKDSWQVARFDPTTFTPSAAPASSEDGSEQDEDVSELLEQEKGVSKYGHEMHTSQHHVLNKKASPGALGQETVSATPRATLKVQEDLDELEAALEARLQRKRGTQGKSNPSPTTSATPVRPAPAGRRAEEKQPADQTQVSRTDTTLPVTKRPNLPKEPAKVSVEEQSAEKRKRTRSALSKKSAVDHARPQQEPAGTCKIGKQGVAERATAPAPSLRHLFIGSAAASGSSFSLSSVLGSSSQAGPTTESNASSWLASDTFQMGASSSSAQAEGIASDDRTLTLPKSFSDSLPSPGKTDGSVSFQLYQAQASQGMLPNLVSEVWAPDAQEFMRTASEEELRQRWFNERRDARATFKKRHKDTVRRLRKRSDKRSSGTLP